MITCPAAAPSNALGSTHPKDLSHQRRTATLFLGGRYVLLSRFGSRASSFARTRRRVARAPSCGPACVLNCHLCCPSPSPTILYLQLIPLLLFLFVSLSVLFHFCDCRDVSFHIVLIPSDSAQRKVRYTSRYADPRYREARSRSVPTLY